MLLSMTRQSRLHETSLGKLKRYAFALCRIEPENNVHVILEAFASAKMNLIFVG